jgi:hypothetical protein
MTEHIVRYKRKLLQDADITKMEDSLRTRIIKLSPRPICDFCGSEYPMYVYASKRMSSGEDITCWRWCACYDCAMAIFANAWMVLKGRIGNSVSRVGHVLGLSDALINRAVDRSLKEFFDNAIEEPEP